MSDTPTKDQTAQDPWREAAEKAALEEARSYSDDPARKADYIAGWHAGRRAEIRCSFDRLIERAQKVVAPLIEREKQIERTPPDDICFADKIVVGVWNCVKTYDDGDTWLDTAVAISRVKRLLAPLRARLAAAEAERDKLWQELRWRDVNTEPLPEPDTKVLVFGPGRVLDCAVFRVRDDGGANWTNYDWHRDIPLEEDYVTHWMPLPSPPLTPEPEHQP